MLDMEGMLTDESLAGKVGSWRAVLIERLAAEQLARPATQVQGATEIQVRMQQQAIDQAAGSGDAMGQIRTQAARWVRMQQLAELLYDLNPDRKPWDGEPFTLSEARSRGLDRAKVALAQAEAVLAFEVSKPVSVSDVPGAEI